MAAGDGGILFKEDPALGIFVFSDPLGRGSGSGWASVFRRRSM